MNISHCRRETAAPPTYVLESPFEDVRNLVYDSEIIGTGVKHVMGWRAGEEKTREPVEGGSFYIFVASRWLISKGRPHREEAHLTQQVGGVNTKNE